MHAILIACAGGSSALWLMRVGRASSVRDRLRTTGPRRTRLPAVARRRLVVALDAAALDVEPEEAISTWMLGGVVAAVLGFGVGGATLAMSFVAMVALGGPIGVYSLRHRRAQQIAIAVPELLERVASELRAGGTIATALDACATGTGGLTHDLARVNARTRLGATTGEALAQWSSERPVLGVDAAAGALALCSRVGGQSADALDDLAASLRDRIGVAAEARALSAQARLSALVIGGAPIAYLAWSAVVDTGSTHALLASTLGRVCLLSGLALDGAGLWWMQRIVRAGSVG